MFCPKCGHQNPDNSAACAGCGAALVSAQPGMQPAQGAGPQPAGQPPTVAYAAAQRADIPNHLVWAILATVLCCLPFGVVAIIQAAQVNGHITSGNLPAAQAASDSAKKWCWISFGCSAVVMVIYGILAIFGVLVGA